MLQCQVVVLAPVFHLSGRIETEQENDQDENDWRKVHGFSHHRQKIARARMPRRTPSNGLETANQKETSHPGSRAVEVVFIQLSHGFEGRHFTNSEVSFSLLQRRTQYDCFAINIISRLRRPAGCYLDAVGAKEATIFSNRGSPRRGSQKGENRRSPGVTPPGTSNKCGKAAMAESRSPKRA